MKAFLFKEGCSNSASLTPASVWLAVSRHFHTFWIRLLTERTKVVTMGAPLKLNGLQIFFFVIFSKSSSGFSLLRIWKSSIPSELIQHRATAVWISSLSSASKTDLVLHQLSEFLDIGAGLRTSDCDRRKNSGVKREERLREGKDADRV